MESLDDLLGLSPNDPVMRRAEILVENDAHLVRQLVSIRRAKNLTQQQVARELGITQASVAAFERPDNDPKLSTIRRYAQAVGALVAHNVEEDTGQLFDHRAATWTSVTLSEPVFHIDYNPRSSSGTQIVFAASAADSKRTDFALAG